MVVVAEVWDRSGLHHALCTYYDMACHESMDTSYIRSTTFLRVNTISTSLAAISLLMCYTVPPHLCSSYYIFRVPHLKR